MSIPAGPLPSPATQSPPADAASDAAPDAAPAAARVVVTDPARLAVLRATGLLDHRSEVFDRAARLAARLLGASAAFVSLVDEDRDVYPGAAGLPEPLASARALSGETLCHHTLVAATPESPLVIPDTRADPVYARVPTVQALGVAAYVGVPLVVRGQPLGALCVIDTVPHAWTEADVELMRELAESARRELELRLAGVDAEHRAAELEARSALAERERDRVGAILNSISDAFFAVDRAWRFTYLNDRAEQVLQRPRGALLGRVLWEEFPLAVGSRFEEEYLRAMASGVAVAFEAYYPAPLDTWYEVRAYPGPEGLAVYFQDINERRRTLQALAESEERFRTVQEASPNGFLMLRPERGADGRVENFTYTFVNPAGARILAGRRPEDLLGRRLLALFPGVAKDGLFARYVHVAESGEQYVDEVMYRHEDLDMGFRLVAVRVGGDVALTFSDETPRLRAQARLSGVFDQAPIAIAVLEGPEHVYTIVSPMYAAAIGGGRRLLGRPVRDAFPEIAGTGYFEIMDRVYATGEPYFGAEQRVALMRGGPEPEERFVNVGYQPLRDDRGSVYAIASASYDVTDQVRARREVEAAHAAAERARREAEKANRARADFLAVMSHELRTPLNAIGGYAELMEMGVQGPVTEQQREYLSRIQRSQRHLLGLVNEVLNYAKLESGSVRYDTTDVDVLPALVEAEGLVAPQARAKSLSLTVAACPNDLVVGADREKVRQVLVNLLSNAVKFTESGGVEIGAWLDSASGRVTIRVRDTGIGIPPDKLEAIFEPFVQVRADLTRPQEGTGLGLAISRDLARGMGGDLTAESTLGAGSAFTLTLPSASAPPPSR